MAFARTEVHFGHARQLESVLCQYLASLCGRVDMLPGADADVDGRQAPARSGVRVVPCTR